ncbi:hypothetical protein ES702_02007 [subsurface metagenome]
MKKNSREGLTVRLPLNIANEVKKLRDDRELPSYGIALQYWIRQQLDQQIDSRLIKLEEITGRIEKAITFFEDRVIRTDEKGITTAGWLATVLETLDGKGGSKDFLERFEKVNEMPIKKLFQERLERRAKVEHYKKMQKKKQPLEREHLT